MRSSSGCLRFSKLPRFQWFLPSAWFFQIASLLPGLKIQTNIPWGLLFPYSPGAIFPSAFLDWRLTLGLCRSFTFTPLVNLFVSAEGRLLCHSLLESPSPQLRSPPSFWTPVRLTRFFCPILSLYGRIPGLRAASLLGSRIFIVSAPVSNKLVLSRIATPFPPFPSLFTSMTVNAKVCIWAVEPLAGLSFVFSISSASEKIGLPLSPPTIGPKLFSNFFVRNRSKIPAQPSFLSFPSQLSVRG